MTNHRIIFTNPDTGIASIIIPAPGISIARALQDVPEGVTDAQVVLAETLPTDRTFRGAWVKNGKQVEQSLGLAKPIAHDIRRAKRAAEFAPHDDAIAKQLPGKAAVAEAARAAIRAKYDEVQVAIDSAPDVASLKAVLELA